MPEPSETENKAWRIEHSDQVSAWIRSLSPRDANRIGATISKLEQHGPGLRRPYVGFIKGSRHHNMKELRSVGGNLRVLFAFDPRGHAMLLAGGDKTGDWKGWYKRHIRLADNLYDKHLRTLGKEGNWRETAARAGARSVSSR